MSRRPRDLLLRVLLTIGLVAPATLLYLQLDDRLAQQGTLAGRELIGVEYVRSLEPLAAALAKTQTAAVAGSGNKAALEKAASDVDAVDSRHGEDLGVAARWKDVRTRISALPASGDPRTVLTAYGDVAELVRVLTERTAQLSGLPTDANKGTYYLNRAITSALPDLLLAAGRFSDLAAVTNGTAVDDLAELKALASDTERAAGRLVDDVQAAVGALEGGSAIYGSLEAIRIGVDKFLGATGPVAKGASLTFDADVSRVATQRDQLASAGASLSATLVAELAAALADRRDMAAQDATVALAALGLIVVLGLLPTVFGIIRSARWRKQVREAEARDHDDQDAPAVHRAGAGQREPVGAAR